MAVAYIREYADIAVTASKYAPAPAEPGLADQTVTTSGTSAQSAAFGANTRLIALSSPAAQAVCYLVGDNPTALVASLRVPANNMIFIGVKAGQKIALIDVT